MNGKFLQMLHNRYRPHLLQSTGNAVHFSVARPPSSRPAPHRLIGYVPVSDTLQLHAALNHHYDHEIRSSHQI